MRLHSPPVSRWRVRGLGIRVNCVNPGVTVSELQKRGVCIDAFSPLSAKARVLTVACTCALDLERLHAVQGLDEKQYEAFLQRSREITHPLGQVTVSGLPSPSVTRAPS